MRCGVLLGRAANALEMGPAWLSLVLLKRAVIGLRRLPQNQRPRSALDPESESENELCDDPCQAVRVGLELQGVPRALASEECSDRAVAEPNKLLEKDKSFQLWDTVLDFEEGGAGNRRTSVTRRRRERTLLIAADLLYHSVGLSCSVRLPRFGGCQVCASPIANQMIQIYTFGCHHSSESNISRERPGYMSCAPCRSCVQVLFSENA